MIEDHVRDGGVGNAGLGSAIDPHRVRPHAKGAESREAGDVGFSGPPRGKPEIPVAKAVFEQSDPFGLSQSLFRYQTDMERFAEAVVLRRQRDLSKVEIANYTVVPEPVLKGRPVRGGTQCRLPRFR
jgi:hypothetical protein